MSRPEPILPVSRPGSVNFHQTGKPLKHLLKKTRLILMIWKCRDRMIQIRCAMRETLQQRKTCPAIPFPEMIFPGIPFREMMFPATICPAIAFRSATFPATIFQGIPFPVMIFPEMTLLERNLQKGKRCRARTL